MLVVFMFSVVDNVDCGALMSGDTPFMILFSEYIRPVEDSLYYTICVDEEYPWGNFVVRKLIGDLKENRGGATTIWMDIVRKKDGRVVFDSHKYDDEWMPVSMPVEIIFRDLDGDGRDELYVEFFSGGMSCCNIGYIFRQVGDTVELVQGIPAGSAFLEMEDIDGDGDVEFVLLDNVLVHAFTSRAKSPMAYVVLSYDPDSGRWTCSKELTRMYNALKIREEGEPRVEDKSQYAECIMEGETCALYPEHLDRAMKLVYAGRVEEAKKYLFSHWMGSPDGARDFWNKFIEEIKKSTWSHCIF